MAYSEFDERTFCSEDGLELYYRDYNPNSPRVPIMCWGGLTRNSKDFDDLAPYLAGKGYRVLCPDQRGRGKSAYDPNPQNYSPLTYVHDMINLLGQEQIGRIIAVGTSMGGIMIMLLAALKNDMLAGAVLNDIGPEIDPKGLSRIAGYVGKGSPLMDWQEAAAASKAMNGDFYPDFGPEDWMVFARRTFEEFEGAIIPAYDPKIAEAFGSEDGPAELWATFDALSNVPTLVLRGERSDILSAATVTKMKERKPDLRMLEVASRGHVPLMTEPSCLQAINGFLTEIAN